MDRDVIRPDAIQLCSCSIVASSSSKGAMSNRPLSPLLGIGVASAQRGVPTIPKAALTAPRRRKSLRSMLVTPLGHGLILTDKNNAAFSLLSFSAGCLPLVVVSPYRINQSRARHSERALSASAHQSISSRRPSPQFVLQYRA